MIGVMTVPTGICAAIGGHAGDANPTCKLLASCCDTLITHPNVVNASDINEMPENVLYVEGSSLDRFLDGKINLETVRTYNKILLVCNRPITKDTINAVNAARVTIGADIKILGLNRPVTMKAYIQNGIATGGMEGVDDLVCEVGVYDFDVLAIHTSIEVERQVALNYFRNGGTNPWGGIEAKLSRMVSEKLNKPVAHAPIESADQEEIESILSLDINPRMAPEVISSCYLHCILKGLHKAPKLIGVNKHKGINISDVDWIVTPYGCWDRAQRACYKANIPVITVKENKTCLRGKLSANSIDVENYWEAAGYVMSLKAGINPLTARSSENEKH